MEVGGRSALGSAAMALVLAVSAAGCAAEEGPDRPGAEAEAAVTTAAPSPSPPPTPEGPPRVLIAKAFRGMQIAFERKDARSAVRRMTPLAVAYLKTTQRNIATAGPAKIERLSIWQKLVLTLLRTDHDVDLVGGLSPEAFLDYVFSYDLNFFPSSPLREDRIKITGPREAVAVIGRSPVWFQLIDGEWRVDVRGVFEGLSFFTKRFAKREGLTTDEVIESIAEVRANGDVPSDVWEKPE